MALIRGETAYGLLPVGGGHTPPPPMPELLAVAADVTSWWAEASFGHWQPRPVPLPGIMLPQDPSAWCAHGGMGPGPRNGAALARAALLALPPGTGCPPHVVLVVAGPVAPHAWRVADGGVPVTPGNWVRQYAALPARARLGAWVHEMAHLLLGWPDLPTSPCLMGKGATRNAGHAPAQPNPTLAAAAGWLRRLAATPDMPTGDLPQDAAMELDWQGGKLLITRQGMVFAIHFDVTPGPALASVELTNCEAPLLASLVPVLSTIGKTYR